MTLSDAMRAAQRRMARVVGRAPFDAVSRVPLVSFTFDDAPSSACRAGRAILEDHGVRGTYYMACGLFDRPPGPDDAAAEDEFDVQDMVDLYRAGHEIGSHGFAHVSYQSQSMQDIAHDLLANDRYMARMLPGHRSASFSYPFGGVGPLAKLCVSRRFSCARGILPGVNNQQMDTLLLRANPLYQQRMRADDVDALLDQAWQQRGWVIFYTHDVREQPSSVGVTPALLAHTVSRAVRMGFDVLPVKHALARAVFDRG